MSSSTHPVFDYVLKKDQNKRVFNKTVKTACKDMSQEEYTRALYQTAYDLQCGMTPKNVLDGIKKHHIVWKHPCFEEMSLKIAEQDDFINNPFQVEEGVLECHKCGNKRVYSYSKQVRSADEPMTTFAQCIQCKNKWVYNG